MNFIYLNLTLFIKENSHIRYTVPFFILFVFSSCSKKPKDFLFNNGIKHDTPIENYLVKNGYENKSAHIISIDDQLSIRNLQNPDLITGITSGAPVATSVERPYRVEADSTVSVPVIGKVKVTGLTIIEAEEKIGRLYRQNLLKAPIIDISIINLSVTLLGEVTKQGNYQLTKEKTNLVEILGEAGGLNTNADKKSLQIIRGDLNNPQVIFIDLTDINSLANKGQYLKNNDIIYARPSRFSQTSNKLQVLSPFIQTSLLILNSIILLKQFSK